MLFINPDACIASRAPLLPAAARHRGKPVRAATSRKGVQAVAGFEEQASRSSSSHSFAELKRGAQDEYNKVRYLLPTLEKALQLASLSRRPAEDAEAAWQERHSKLAELTGEVNASLAAVRAGIVDAAGGEAAATSQLLRHHLRSRLHRLRDQLEPLEWQVFVPAEVSVPVPGAQCLTQVATCQVGERHYAVVCLALGGPFLSNNMQSLLLHWAAARQPGGEWEQPPAGWHSFPANSHAQGSKAWQTPFERFAPVVDNIAVEDACVHSVILQLPLEGALAGRGGSVGYVLRRTDGGGPEWLKQDHHHDFYLDLTQAIEHFIGDEEGNEEGDAMANVAIDAAAPAAAAPFAGSSRLQQLGAGRGSTISRSGKDWPLLMMGGLDDWDWARSIAAAAAARKAAEDAAAAAAAEAESMGAAVATSCEESWEDKEEDEACKDGWLSQASSWEELQGYPTPSTPPSQQLQRLAVVAKALAAHQEHTRSQAVPCVCGPQMGPSAEVVLQQCRDVAESLGALTAASSAADAAQARKEQLHEVHVKAEAALAQLQSEVRGALDSARRAAVRLRGRETEITQGDLEILAAQLAEEMCRREEGHQLVFLQESVMRVAGLEGQVVVHIYAEGTAAPAAPAAAPPAYQPAAHLAETTVPLAYMGAAPATAAAAAGAAPAFHSHSLLVSVAVGEDFPDAAGKNEPLALHWATVHHEHGSWLPPPAEGWSASSEGSSREGAATQTPLQRFIITLSEGGGPVLVDPMLRGVCLRLPPTLAGTQGMEFVLKAAGGAWLQRRRPDGRAGNFFVALPPVAA